MAINLSKGQKINLSKDSGLTQVRLGLGWDPIKVKGFFGRTKEKAVDLDASVTSLERGAGASDLQLDGAAFHLAGDSGDHAWFGPYPPAGDGDHRYVFAVHALDVDTLGLDGSASAAAVACQVSFHALGRALLTATYSVPGEPGAAAFLRDGQ